MPGGYTWHLSVIDAGQPRQESSGDEFVQVSQSSVFDPVSWTGADLDQAVWILADKDGMPIKKLHFGMHGATPVTGDWDGSGTTKIGVFIDGLWFLDLNGNGVWDKGDLWVKLGKKGDQPVTGDWNGDGKTDIGIFGPTLDRRHARRSPPSRACPVRSIRRTRAGRKTCRPIRPRPPSAIARSRRATPARCDPT